MVYLYKIVELVVGLILTILAPELYLLLCTMLIITIGICAVVFGVFALLVDMWLVGGRS